MIKEAGWRTNRPEGRVLFCEDLMALRKYPSVSGFLRDFFMEMIKWK